MRYEESTEGIYGREDKLGTKTFSWMAQVRHTLFETDSASISLCFSFYSASALTTDS